MALRVDERVRYGRLDVLAPRSLIYDQVHLPAAVGILLKVVVSLDLVADLVPEHLRVFLERGFGEILPLEGSADDLGRDLAAGERVAYPLSSERVYQGCRIADEQIPVTINLELRRLRCQGQYPALYVCHPL